MARRRGPQHRSVSRPMPGARVGRPGFPRSSPRSSRIRSSAATWPQERCCPTEPVLCEQFGFSRTVIREALKLLEERGLVRVEQGRGTTVQPREAWNLLDPRRDPDRARVRRRHVAARQPDRRSAACSSARWRAPPRQALSDDDLAALAENLERMEASYDDYERFRVIRPRVSRDRDEGLGQRGRPDDRAHDPPPRRGHAAAGIGGVAAQRSSETATDAPRDLRGAGGPRRRAGRRADRGAHRLALGRAEGYAQRRT